MLMKTPPGMIGANALGMRASARGALCLIALTMLAPFALYFATARSIVAVWNSSETFAHGYLILPISLWLVWRRRANFTAYPPQPYWPALPLLAGAGAVWLAARMGEVQVVQQYAFVAMIPILALALLGKRLAGSLAFPLLFMLFAVPFGEIFVAPLIDFTANFTIWAVQLTGIPVLRNGTRFELPSGSWSVVEACSGVRYLISSITLGCLYAYLTFHSASRRAIFVALSVVVPVIANGLRAFMIVMIGHYSGMTMAVGVDHLIYGWLFFGLVMFIMFWIGSYWREDMPAPQAPGGAAASGASFGPGPRRIGAIAAAALALAALWPALAALVDNVIDNPRPPRVTLAGISWPATAAVSGWNPQFMAPDFRVAGAYRKDGVQPVELTLLYYRNQRNDKALISSVNRLTGEKDAWHETGSRLRTETVGARTLAIRESTLQGPRGALLVWHWMWVDGRYTASSVAGKLWQARAKLLLRGDDGAALLAASPYGERPDQARAALRAFLAANLTAIDAALAAARER